MPHADPATAKVYFAKRYRDNRKAILAKVKKRADEKRDEIREYHSQWYQENKEKIAVKTKIDRAENPEKFRQSDAAKYVRQDPEVRRLKAALKYQRDKDKIKARVSAYMKENPDVRANSQQKRRALKIGAVAEHVLRKDILDRDGPNCALCGVTTIQPIYLKPVKNERHYDHIVPLCRGGTHSMGNMRILCAGCNLRKHTRLDNEL